MKAVDVRELVREETEHKKVLEDVGRFLNFMKSSKYFGVFASSSTKKSDFDIFEFDDNELLVNLVESTLDKRKERLDWIKEQLRLADAAVGIAEKISG